MIILTISRRLLVLCLSFCFINVGSATTYHVAVTGSDTASGSVTDPFKTIAKAATMVEAGDTVLVSGGVYLEKNITPKSSGTENAMIVFRANPGNGDVVIKHPAESLTDNTPVFQLSSRNYIWIEGFHFKDFQYGRACIYISSGEGNVVINNRFENLGNGEVGSWDGNQMVALFNSSRNVVCNNYFENIIGDGINVNSQRSEHNLISNNTFINFTGKLRSWGGQWLFSRAIDVQDMSNGNNVVAFNHADDVIHHIWLDRDGSNNIVLRNIGRKGSGLVFNESRCADNVIQENISMEMKVGYMTAYYETTGWTYDPRWVNNVAYNNQTGFSIHKSMRDEFRNNISYNNTDFNLKFTSEALSNAPHIFSNNLWFSDDKEKSIEFKGSAVSVADFQTAIGETNGLSEDPMFASIVSGAEDFTLQEGSSAIGAADNGFNLGAYAVYPKTEYGWDPNLQTTGPKVYFDQVITTAHRDSTVQVLLKLSETSPIAISADIVPIAGDAVTGEDFELLDSALTFQPGETSKTLSIDIKGEAKYDELVAFRIENVENAIPGARSLHILVIKKTPILTANAGLNRTVMDDNNSGSADVVLDGSESTTPQGTIISYVWSIGDDQITTGETTTVNLPLGVHTITLTVTNSEGDTASHDVVITVLQGSGIWLEAECGVVGSLWNVETDEEASNGQYVTIKPENNSLDSAPNDATGLLTYTFEISESGSYTIFIRAICPDPNADSFWLKMNNGAFASWNNIGPSTSWQWFAYPNAYNLSAGTHTLTVGYREDEAKLDKLWITNGGIAPEDEGQAASNCGTSADNYELGANVNVYPNPVSDKLTITLPGLQVSISVYNSIGQRLLHQIENTTCKTIDMAHLKQGIYFVKISGQHETIVKKIIKN